MFDQIFDILFELKPLTSIPKWGSMVFQTGGGGLDLQHVDIELFSLGKVGGNLQGGSTGKTCLGTCPTAHPSYKHVLEGQLSAMNRNC